jgi:uncharacterized RDD family membrane protein YckC
MNPILDAPYVPEQKVEYAGFWIRVIASIIDGVILGIVDASLRFAIFGSVFARELNSETSGTDMIYQLLLLCLGVAYYVVLESSYRQATIGKMAFGLKVSTESGERITAVNALGRYFAKILSAIILLIGYIMVAFDARKQGLHDKLARTVVYYSKD